VFTFSSFSPTEFTVQKQIEFSFWSDNQNLNAADKTERERRKTQSNYTGSFHKPEVVLSPLHFQGEFTKKCNIKLQLLNATTSKRLQITQAQLQEISYAPEHSQETSNAQAQLQETFIAQAHKQETSIAQAHKQETSNQTELQRSLFEVEHLIYN